MCHENLHLRQVVSDIRSGWDTSQPIYSVDEEGIKNLIKAGAELISLNTKKGDGIYYHELRALGSRFKGSTLQPL